MSSTVSLLGPLIFVGAKAETTVEKKLERPDCGCTDTVDRLPIKGEEDGISLGESPKQSWGNDRAKGRMTRNWA